MNNFKILIKTEIVINSVQNCTLFIFFSIAVVLIKSIATEFKLCIHTLVNHDLICTIKLFSPF